MTTICTPIERRAPCWLIVVITFRPAKQFEDILASCSAEQNADTDAESALFG